MVTSKLINGDSAEQLKKLEDNSVDLLCTDPPYGYSFMGKSWDNTLPPREIFEESLRVLKPGSFAFVMSAPRSDVQYRMAQMLDEVGFEVGFTPIYWTYATGFPKAMNIGKAVDKRLGAERKVIGTKIGKGGENLNKLSRENKGDDEEAKGMGAYGVGAKQVNVEIPITEPKSDEAKKLDGSYGGYQPKPAIEVVIVAMKPLSQKGYLDQSLDNQKGITWLDDCRIPFENMGKESKTANRKSRQEGQVFKSSGFGVDDNATASPLGRFSANLLVSDDTLEENFSRYYSLDAWWNSRMDKLPDEVRNTFPFLVVPKASKSEKNIGLDDFEVKQKDTRTDTGKGSFTDKGLQPGKNIHPTVKPLNLMSYLVTLGSRNNDVVLDPFMGSGTTPMACVTLSRNYIGIEREDEYFKIAEARVNKLEKPMKQWEQWL